MSGPEAAVSPELQSFIQRETQVAQVQSMIATLTEVRLILKRCIVCCCFASQQDLKLMVCRLQVCWDTCISSPGSYLSSKESACLENCARRFVETTQYILQRAAHKADNSGTGGF